jgi:hypothetical protein
MTHKYPNKLSNYFAAIFLSVFVLTACSFPRPAEVAVQTMVVPVTVVVQRVVTRIIEVVVTSTPEPRLDPTTTPSPIPFYTLAAPLPGVNNPGVMPEGFNAWCSTLDTVPAEQEWIQPNDARMVQMVNGIPELIFPAQSCTFVFTLKEPLTAATELWLFDLASSPWLKKPLLPIPDKPNAGYIILTHDYIVNPPVWATLYRFELHADSNLLWSKEVNFINSKRPTWRCRTNDTSLGAYPDPVTGHCSPDIELHPWDVGYGTPGPGG